MFLLRTHPLAWLTIISVYFACMLAAFLSTLAARGAAQRRQCIDVAALLAAWYALTAAWLGPFAATPVDWLQK